MHIRNFAYKIDFLDGGDSEGYHKNKAKRVRTTFTEEQLQVLQANFQLDSNPDGQDLERIAQITGLSKRVTQVWFQNSRARQKKHLHTGKLKTPSKIDNPSDFYLHFRILRLICGSFSVHHPAASIARDEGTNFGRHINLHLTYSFQSPQNAKSPVFVPRRECTIKFTLKILSINNFFTVEVVIL